MILLLLSIIKLIRKFEITKGKTFLEADFLQIETIIAQMKKKKEGLSKGEKRKVNNDVRLAWTQFLGDLMSGGLGKDYVNYYKPSHCFKERRDAFLKILSQVVQNYFFGRATAINMNNQTKNAETKVLTDNGNM
jgi:hypothetical protein